MLIETEAYALNGWATLTAPRRSPTSSVTCFFVLFFSSKAVLGRRKRPAVLLDPTSFSCRVAHQSRRAKTNTVIFLILMHFAEVLAYVTLRTARQRMTFNPFLPFGSGFSHH